MNKQILTFGKYKNELITNIIKKDLEYCVWLVKNIKYVPFSKKQLKEIEIQYYNKYGDFPFKLLYTAENLKYNGVSLKALTKEDLQLCYENVPELRWAVKLIHQSRKKIFQRKQPIFQTDDIN